MSAVRWTSALTLSLLMAAGPSLLTTAGAADDLPNLAGNWTWSWKDPSGKTHRHLLEVEGIGAKLAARERFDDLEPIPVRDLRLDGKTLQFSVVRGDRRADYRGIVADRDTINGTVKVTANGESSEDRWEASRKPQQEAPPPPPIDQD
jgi:hypothetical protein